MTTEGCSNRRCARVSEGRPAPRPVGQWGAAAACIVACLIVGAFARAQGIATRGAAPAGRRAFSGKPFEASFVDVAEAAGLRMKFVYGKQAKKDYIIEVNGAGVAWVDVDADGWLDAFLVNGFRLDGFPSGSPPTSRLFRNAGDGTFIDITRKANVGVAGWGNGVCAGDYDNDGAVDLYVTYWGENLLYQNNGDGTFSEVAREAGVAGPREEWSSGCTFLDFDRDGHLDLFVTSYQAFDLSAMPKPGSSATCEWKGMPVFCGPRGLPYGNMTLYHNNGDGTFEDVTSKAGIRGAQDVYAFTAVAADLNRDGWTDIYVASDSTPSVFFRNNGDGTFAELGTETGLAFNEHGFEQGGMGVGVGDFNRDGWLDVVKTNFAGDYPNLYRNLGRGVFEDIVVSAGLAVNPQFVGWGVAFADLDNDGLQDVLHVSGHVYPELEAQDKIDEEYRQRRAVYRNLGGNRFEDVAELAGPAVKQKKSSRGAAFGDYDNDGDIDVLVMNMGEAPSLLRNDLRGERRWIRVQLQGTKSNRSAIGAIVTIHTGDGGQTLPVLSQSSYISQNDFRLHFGLGSRQAVDGFTVRWPSGDVEEFPGTEAGQTVLLVEGSGEVKPVVIDRPAARDDKRAAVRR